MSNLLTLGDATLRTDDLALLVPPAWLNDALISFWLEHLTAHVLPPDARAVLLPPNLAFFLALCNDADARGILRDVSLGDAELALLPVNDSLARDPSAVAAPSGTHWSLLVLERCTGTFFHLDSLAGCANSPFAAALAAKLQRLMQLPSAPCVPLNVPLQQNSYDCGAYLCIFAEDVVRQHMDNSRIADLYIDAVPPSPADVEAKRQEIGKLVCRLVDERQRREAGERASRARE